VYLHSSDGIILIEAEEPSDRKWGSEFGIGKMSKMAWSICNRHTCANSRRPVFTCSKSCVTAQSWPTILIIWVHSSVFVYHGRLYVIWQQAGWMLPPWFSMTYTVFVSSFCARIADWRHHCLQITTAVKIQMRSSELRSQLVFARCTIASFSYCRKTAYSQCIISQL